MSSRIPSQEDLQRIHAQRIEGLEKNLEEAKRFIQVNAQQIAMIREMLGLPPDFPGKAQPT